MSIKPGVYEHYKGSLYQVIELARHSETEEILVIYRALYGEQGLWARPLDMFSEDIEVNGRTTPRFQRLESQTGVLELAILDVIAGQEQEFEKAFGKAQAIIAGSDGYIAHSLRCCVETPNRYLLLVEWLSLEHHNEGFRGSEEYQEWKRLLHHFYEPFPEVLHFTQTP